MPFSSMQNTGTDADPGDALGDDARRRWTSRLTASVIVISTAMAIIALVLLHGSEVSDQNAARDAAAVVTAAHDLDAALGAAVLNPSQVRSRGPQAIPATRARLTAAIRRLEGFKKYPSLISLLSRRGRQFDAAAVLAERAALSGDTAASVRTEVDVVAPSFTSLSETARSAIGALESDSEQSVQLSLVAAIALLLAQTTLVVWLIELVNRANRRRSAAGTAARAELRFRSLVQNATDIVGICDQEGRVSYISPAVEQVLGCRPEELVGKTLTDLIHPDDVPALDASAEVLADVGRTLRITYRAQHRDGRWIHLDHTITNRLDDPIVNGIVWNARDITEQLGLQDQLIFQAFHDPLTGLANRALFSDRVTHALQRARRTATSVGVIFIDLDGFKNVNDTVGHESGDQLLRDVGVRLSQTLRPGDTLARLGGDEFAALLEDVDSEEAAVATAERLVAALRVPFEHRSGELFVSASAGVVVTEAGLQDTDELVRDADVAMYVAKVRGKDRVELFENDMRQTIVDRAQLTADLHHAVERHQLRVVYQPAVDLVTGHMEGVEALVRWDHPTRGAISPLDFIPLAESSGQISAIGTWVLTEACRTALPWLSVNPTFTVAVNVSPYQLQDPNFVEEVASILTQTHFPSNRLVLEVTESTLMDDPVAGTARLEGLKELGIRLAIDDFGTGYSSLAQLKSFPVDIIKIDKAFVDGMTGTPDGDAFVNAIVELAHSLGLGTIAEGVELSSQQRALQLLGCDLAQGFFFAQPLAARELGAMLHSQPEFAELIA